MTSAFSWQKSISLCPDSFPTPRPNLPVYPRCSLTSYFCIPVPYNEKDIFLRVSSKRSCRSSQNCYMFIGSFIIYEWPKSNFLSQFFKIFIDYFWLCWVFIAMRAFSLVAVSEGYSLVEVLRLLWWLLLFRSRLQGLQAQVVAARGRFLSQFSSQGGEFLPWSFKETVGKKVKLAYGDAQMPMHYAPSVF